MKVCNSDFFCGVMPAILVRHNLCLSVALWVIKVGDSKLCAQSFNLEFNIFS